DGRLARAVMSIQAIKAVEIGLGVEAARRPGSRVVDPIEYDSSHSADDRRFGFRRPTNNAGGIEGGTSNGEPIIVRASKKPISTLAARRPSVNMATKAAQPASYERSDVCAVPAASVIVENVVAFEIAAAVIEKYVGTSLDAIRTAHDALHALNRRQLEEWATVHPTDRPASRAPEKAAPGPGEVESSQE
ncbi:MAG TPA: chorismate synthase, partial [Isosphaeraceae bacterium]|nr:chorismate synthase [Isosphaeraceae bacterium]